MVICKTGFFHKSIISYFCPLMIQAKDIKLFLDRWGQGVVAIGKLNDQSEIQTKTARKFIGDFYGYNDFPVLFTPTKAAEQQFRNTPEDALSYFVAGNRNFPEDHGFAKEPWTKV
ncbi:MAG: phosphoribosyl-AMP cyclohydrolase, partial [Candidatus Zixiibacteriota bacterium]